MFQPGPPIVLLDTPGPGSPTSPTTRPKLNTLQTKQATAHRLPPPALFQGPPSRNASHISLALPTERPSTADLEGPRPGRSNPRASRIPPASSFSGPSGRQPQPRTPADDFPAESLWADMQKTLADVELSVMNPSQVFGARHAKALEELRTAQLALAQTWAKSEADEQGDHDFETDAAADANVSALKTEPSTGKRGKNGGRNVLGNDRVLQQETERDIELARKRREANDRYFQQVNKGVLDVVSKLDEVANAMRRVEKESREIWNESSDGDYAGTETATNTDGSIMADSPVEPRKR